MSNVPARERIRQTTERAFKNHQILERTPTSVTVGRPDSGIERFTFYDLPHGVLFTGNLGSVFIARYDLAWLRQHAGNPNYVAEKISAIEGDLRVYCSATTLAALDDLPEAYGEFTPEQKRELEELKSSIRVAEDTYPDPLWEACRLFAESSFYDGDMPHFWDWAPRLYWMLEAAALLDRLEAAE